MCANEITNNGITPKTAYVMNDQFDATSAKELKAAVNEELQRLLQNGEITEEQAKAAKKYLKSDNLAEALVRRNNVERTAYQTIYGVEDLEDEKANQLMKDAGLTINDLYQASTFAGADYEVSYTKLSKKERQRAENGELTASELKNIQNTLNEKIKANGGDKVLNEKETKQLMRGLGLSIEKKIDIGNFLLKIFGSGVLGGTIGGAIGGAFKHKVKAEAVYADATTGSKVSATQRANTIGSVLMAGAVAGAAAGIVNALNHEEEPYGKQGGAEGGAGSVTNKTEAKMHEVGVKAGEALEKGELPTPKPVENPYKELFEQE